MQNEIIDMKAFLGVSIAVFLSITLVISTLVEAPEVYINEHPKIQRLLLAVIIAIVIISFLSPFLSLMSYLFLLFSVILIMPVTILVFWNNLELKKVEPGLSNH